MALPASEDLYFAVDAAIINRLGRELVQRQETALSELVKNSYDADAKRVTIVFKDESLTEESEIELIDDGAGMDRNELINGFLRIASSTKSTDTASAKFSRPRAGRKGIGRFSVQRLARKLVLISEKENASYSIQATFDWDNFESGKDLLHVSSSLKFFPPSGTAGTKLKLIGLREAWSDKQIRKTFKYVSELIAPNPISVNEDVVDPGFKAFFYRRDLNGSLEEVASDEIGIFDHALAKICAGINPDGIPWCEVTSSRYAVVIPPEILQSQSFSKLIAVNPKLEAYYYITKGQIFSEDDDYPKHLSASFAEYLKSHGGIKLYRNNFRVPPYGDPENDWIGLESSSTRRAILPPHANRNFLGWVSITDVADEYIEETSSREGFIHNDLIAVLSEFSHLVLTETVKVIASLRGRKVTASQKGFTSSIERTPKEKVIEAINVLEEIISPKQGRITFNEETDKRKYQEAKENLEDLIETLDEVTILRVLASVGLSILEFSHEIKNTLLNDSLGLSKLLSDPIVKANPDLQQSLQSVSKAIDNLKIYTGFFTELAPTDIYSLRNAIRVDGLISQFVEAMTPAAARKGIVIEYNSVGYNNWITPMHPSEILSIFLNFYSNSLKAIKNKSILEGRILITTYNSGGVVFIDFCDNGIGIPEENKDRVFDLFFSTMPPIGQDAIEAELQTGTGIGLKIVRDIIELHRGKIYVSEPPVNYSTCIRIELPLASDSEIGEESF